MTYTQELLQLFEEHVRAFQALAAILSIVSFLFGFLVLRVYVLREKLRRLREHRQLENPGVVVVEAHVLEGDPHEGPIILSVVSWGGKHTLESILHDPILEKQIEKVAAARGGFVQLSQPGQLLFMVGLQEIITGNDPLANIERLKGRKKGGDEVIMCPVTWPGLREAHLIRVVIIDHAWIEHLAEPSVIARIGIGDPRHQGRPEWLHRIALQWAEEQKKPYEVACIWNVTI